MGIVPLIEALVFCIEQVIENISLMLSSKNEDEL